MLRVTNFSRPLPSPSSNRPPHRSPSPVAFPDSEPKHRRGSTTASESLIPPHNYARARALSTGAASEPINSGADRGRDDLHHRGTRSQRYAVYIDNDNSATRRPRISSSSESSSQRPPTPQLSTGSHPRDSLLTQTTGGTGTSLYPPSTSSLSEAESLGSPPLTPSVGDPSDHGIDADDVSYRLKLLVRNNYFLPPPHAKPVLPPKSPNKPRSPTILDIFRGTKPRSPAPPSPGMKATVPTNTVSPVPPSAPLQRPATVRTVVIREKVENLLLAAKEAEAERDSKGDEKSAITNLELSSLVIDPTDSVDVEQVYPKVDLDHSVGIEEVVNNPSTVIPGEDEAWRMALLHQAINLSFQTADSASSISSTMAQPILTNAITPSRTTAPPRPFRPRTKVLDDPRRRNQIEVANSDPRHAVVVDATPNSRSSSNPPCRAETPAAPTRPLAPPPRRPGLNPLFSASQPTLPDGATFLDRESERTLRRTLSTPLLSDLYESEHRGFLSPPPMTLVVDDPDGLRSFPSRSTQGSLTSGSHYSDDEVSRQSDAARPSLTSSIASFRPRPSLSEFHRQERSPRRPLPLTLATQSRIGSPALSLQSVPPSSHDLDAHAQSLADNDDSDSEEASITIFADPRLQTLSNASTPRSSQFGVAGSLSTPIEFDRRMALTNTPSPTNRSFFSRLGLHGQAPERARMSPLPTSTFESSPEEEASPLDDEEIDESAGAPTQDPSLIRLGGLLAEHIEAERDRIKQIAQQPRF